MRICILDGGAVRGAFVGGVLAVLYYVFGPDFFDIMVGTSIGGTSSPFYRNGQIEQGLRYFTKHMPGGFISKTLGIIPRFNLDYLAWVYRNSPDALNVEKFRKMKPVYMPIAHPAGPKFVCLNTEPDPTIPMLSGVRVPILTHSESCIAGREGWDGGFQIQPPICFPRVKEATEVWFLSPEVQGARMPHWKSSVYSLLLAGFDTDLRHMIADMARAENEARDVLDQMANIHVIRPAQELGISWVEQDVKKIERVIEQGKQAARDYLKTYHRTF